MRRSGFCIALLLLFLAGCASDPPRFRDQALAGLAKVREKGGESMFPGEFESIQEALDKGEVLLKDDEGDEAEHYYYLAMMKENLLDSELREERARRKEAARRAEERRKAELAKAAQEEARREAEIRAEALAQKENGESGRKKAKSARGRQLVSSYTVKRGESLPFIASQPEVYGDRNLWPLIYRANRDQISDPRHIWPGQVLQIPRNSLGRDEITEARRYAQERPLR